uniref:RNase H type-1 domain-containing protein n=1 Tax=Cannabis sativa TaxID=3483 RepID=A0A803NZ44_CANSA
MWTSAQNYTGCSAHFRCGLAGFVCPPGYMLSPSYNSFARRFSLTLFQQRVVLDYPRETNSYVGFVILVRNQLYTSFAIVMLSGASSLEACGVFESIVLTGTILRSLASGGVDYQMTTYLCLQLVEFQLTHYSIYMDIPSELGGEKPHQQVHEDTRFRVDASVVREEAGFAAVLIMGNQLADYIIATNFGRVYSVLEGELQGILMALQMASEAGFKMVRIESDSKAAATAFQAGSIPLC